MSLSFDTGSDDLCPQQLSSAKIPYVRIFLVFVFMGLVLSFFAYAGWALAFFLGYGCRRNLEISKQDMLIVTFVTTAILLGALPLSWVYSQKLDIDLPSVFLFACPLTWLLGVTSGILSKLKINKFRFC